MKKLRFAIDLTWVRHKIVGGTESFAHNLLRGFTELKDEFDLVMITSEDNHCFFEKYLKDKRFSSICGQIKSASVFKRILWQNYALSKLLLNNGINLCLEPVYCMPLFTSSKIRFVTVIHDLQALHFPENHSLLTNIWLRIAWKNTILHSFYVIAISNFVRQDIMQKYHINEKKITTIYDPINIDVSLVRNFQEIKRRYDIEKEKYYYTVSKLNKHKNLLTLIKVFAEVKKKGITLIPCKLVISGIAGNGKGDLERLVKEYDLTEEIVLTGFIDSDIRNSLYQNCKAFLFPSIFEGFGMPLIEAISYGAPVITTREACMPEITQNKANYVNNAYSVQEWLNAIIHVKKTKYTIDIPRYYPSNIAHQYLKLLLMSIEDEKEIN